MAKHIWDSERAAQLPKGVEELVYRSNLIGSDRTVCNWGGEYIYENNGKGF